MNILVLNSGSSSIKFSLFAWDSETRTLLEGEASGLGTEDAALTLQGDKAEAPVLHPGDGPDEAGEAIAGLVGQSSAAQADAIGFRIVHPGPHLRDHAPLTPGVLEELRAATKFAPLHQPAALRLIESMGRHLPGTPAFGCFDTIFHQTMPEEASAYALPVAVRAEGLHRYGFHGLSCENVVARLSARADRTLPRRLIVAHLGSGCSVTAILDGVSIDTSMGLTPDGGIVMGTRPGDLDPGVVLYLLRQQASNAGATEDAQITATEQMLNRESGIHALSQLPNDMRAVRRAAATGDAAAELAIRVFTRSVRKQIGSYIALLGGVDCLVFTGGIGEHDTQSRVDICAGLDAFGLVLEPAQDGAAEEALRWLSPPRAAQQILVVRADEDRMIATHVARMMLQRDAAKQAL